MDFTSSSRKNGPIAVLVAGIALTAVGPPGIPNINGEDINVSCYLNSDEGSYLGSLMTFAPETAAQACNKIFYSCKGQCFGCFSDFDLRDDVCYDNKGRRFLK
jgi:hypothetical protein